ncbi:cation:proton antiporter [Ferrovibrio sp.]|uniref:cation:proton antiporter n=1 Tax=Ferrovibrio sp. TaxID=1917215 RepID=UPI003D281F4B
MSDVELSRFFLSLVVLLSAALLFGRIFDFLRLPRVIGEIFAGLLLGPSLFGFFLPEQQAWLFRGFATQPVLLSTFYWLGLILLMFTAGLKGRSEFTGADRKLVGVLVIGSILLPLLIGWFCAPLFSTAQKGDALAFQIVVAIAVSVTSIPVISRIFIDLGMMETRFAQITVAAATIQDLALWVLLAIATALQRGEAARPIDQLAIVGYTLVFAVASVLLGPMLLRIAGRLSAQALTEASLTGYALLVCLVFVALASLLHVNVVFGALLAGIIIGRFTDPRLAAVKQRIGDLAIWFFVPIYFAIVGQRIDLYRDFDAALCFGFLLLSSIVKIISIVSAARLARRPWQEAVDFGVAMNTRGGPGIVLASVAHGAGIIDDRFFLALILASILTSLGAGLWFRWRLARGADFQLGV